MYKRQKNNPLDQYKCKCKGKYCTPFVFIYDCCLFTFLLLLLRLIRNG